MDGLDGSRRRRDELARALRRRWAGGAGRLPGPGRLRAALTDETGATTAEFAIVTMAAVGFAGLLVVILRSDAVRATLEDLVSRALGAAG